MRIWIVLLILLAEVWAITRVFAGRQPAGRKVAWILAIVLLPVVGLAGWLIRGEHRARRGTG